MILNAVTFNSQVDCLVHETSGDNLGRRIKQIAGLKMYSAPPVVSGMVAWPHNYMSDIALYLSESSSVGFAQQNKCGFEFRDAIRFRHGRIGNDDSYSEHMLPGVSCHENYPHQPVDRMP
jgi:hypothetical protein